MIKESKFNELYHHTKNRIIERYNLRISLKVYIQWTNWIQNKDFRASFIQNKNDGKIYRVYHERKTIYLFFINGFIETALTPRGYFEKTNNIKPVRNENRLKALKEEMLRKVA